MPLMPERIESPWPNSGGYRQLKDDEMIEMLLDVAME